MSSVDSGVAVSQPRSIKDFDLRPSYKHKCVLCPAGGGPRARDACGALHLTWPHFSPPRAPRTRCSPCVRVRRASASTIKTIIREVLDTHLKGQKFVSDHTGEWTKDIANEIRQQAGGSLPAFEGDW